MGLEIIYPTKYWRYKMICNSGINDLFIVFSNSLFKFKCFSKLYAKLRNSLPSMSPCFRKRTPLVAGSSFYWCNILLAPRSNHFLGKYKCRGGTIVVTLNTGYFISK